jgi:hypothetical protein
MGPLATDGSAELYDPSTGTFTAIEGHADTGTGSVFGMDALWGATATSLADGSILITTEPTAAFYDPGTGTFSLTGAMTASARGLSPVWYGFPPPEAEVHPPVHPPYIGDRTATLLTNGKVLVAGGSFWVQPDGKTSCGDYVPCQVFVFASAELYDPSAGTFTATGDMTEARYAHIATLLSDGTVLITGGVNFRNDGGGAFLSEELSSAELYDPAGGRFTSTPMGPRWLHTATLLADGTVLIAGGRNPSPFSVSSASAEIYHPAVLAPPFLSGDGRGQGAILK